MNLACIAKSIDGQGGTERDLAQLAAGLAGRGHRVTLYLLRAAAAAAPAGCRVVRIPVLGPGATARLWSLAWLGPRMAGRGGHDLVVSFAAALRQDVIRCGGGTHAAFLEARRAIDAPWRHAVRRFSPHHLAMLAIERRQYQPGHYRRVLAISETVKADLMRTYRVPEAAIRVIQDGVDRDRFHPGLRALHRGPVRSRHGIPPEAPCVVFVGHGFQRKGLDILLQAMARLPDPAWRLLVVGGGAEISTYRSLARRLGLAGRVVFAGPANPEPFYGAADLLALPAMQEAFGNVVMEALACGLPAVVSRLAGAAGLLRNGLEAGLLDNPRDPEELASRLLAVYAGRGSRAAAAAARLAVEDLSAGQNTLRVESLFEDVIREKKAGFLAL